MRTFSLDWRQNVKSSIDLLFAKLLFPSQFLNVCYDECGCTLLAKVEDWANKIANFVDFFGHILNHGIHFQAVYKS